MNNSVDTRYFPLVDQVFSIPDINDRLEALSIHTNDLQSRSGSCEWIVVRNVESSSDVNDLGSTDLGDDFASDIDGYECRGIAFENEEMGIDFAWSIRNILEEIGTDWQMIKCLAENPEFAATANAALDHFSGLTSCEGKSIAEIIEEEILASCGSGGGDEAMSDELVELLEEEEWIDYSGLEEECPLAKCILEELRNNGNQCYGETFSLFEGPSASLLSFTVGDGCEGGDGCTRYLRATGEIQIEIDTEICSGNPLELAATLLHEGVHAELYLEIVRSGLDPNDPASYSIVFSSLAERHYIEQFNEVPDIQHALIVYTNHWLDKISEALWSLNVDVNGNPKFTPEHYRYPTWVGLKYIANLTITEDFSFGGRLDSLYQQVLSDSAYVPKCE